MVHLEKYTSTSPQLYTVYGNYRYRMDDGRIGICRFFDSTLFADVREKYVGMFIEFGKGEHDGTVIGRQYFRCRDGKGLLIRPNRLVEDMGHGSKSLTSKMKKGGDQKLMARAREERDQEELAKRQKVHYCLLWQFVIL